VRFVEDHRVVVRQDGAVRATHGEICKEQMMVDDDDLRLLRLPLSPGSASTSRTRDTSSRCTCRRARSCRARGARRRAAPRPRHGRRLRSRGSNGREAAGGGFVADLEEGRALELPEPVAAKVVVAPFHQTRRDRKAGAVSKERRSLRKIWSCKLRVPVDTITRRPDWRIGIR
jgi:hypothetical protein